MSQKSNGFTNKQIEGLLKSIENIESNLDLLVSLQMATMKKPDVGKEEKKILKLCDKKHTMADIVKATNKKEGTIGATLNHLKAKALIRTVIVDGKTVYERIR